MLGDFFPLQLILFKNKKVMVFFYSQMMAQQLEITRNI